MVWWLVRRKTGRQIEACFSSDTILCGWLGSKYQLTKLNLDQFSRQDDVRDDSSEIFSLSFKRESIERSSGRRCPSSISAVDKVPFKSNTLSS